MSLEKRGIGNYLHDFRSATRKSEPIGWTFICPFCKEKRELRGHKQKNGKKICRRCQEVENND